ncbi:MAG: hypothetical protein K5879_03865 [Lachnospiraceae bacterium]|nr:hypothetical protein [Lachnospiraceae bacterium]
MLSRPEKNPNIVISSDDNKIIDYMDAYPRCQYIHDLLEIIRNNSDDINHAIKAERDKIEEAHKEEFNKLEYIDSFLERIEAA